MKRLVLLFLGLVLLNPVFAFAEPDAQGCKDHPLFTRLENFYISGCKENYNELQLRTSSNKTETKEGNLFYIYYR